ncbi:MAG: hypothetical protein KAR35_03225 [Candidatus Heimdallarchaeota archaeon]|nr:hypothetical protein [Candidatus Heimdallarchaeota archaeon]MCK5048368.1 hypothetical protein [Candidatus Heimdallarchaeota archaeon]
MSYKLLSFIQSIFILVCGISVLDYGLAIYDILDPKDFGFNEMLFDDSSSEWWSMIVFWGYCFLVVGVLQFLKALSAED